MQKYIGEIVQCKTVAIIHENEIVEIQLVFEMCQKYDIVVQLFFDRFDEELQSVIQGVQNKTEPA